MPSEQELTSLWQFIEGAASAFYEADGLDSSTSLTGLSGTVSDNFTYHSFGNVASSTGSFTQPFRCTDREFDPETSLDYYRARYYDPRMGRFISEDPITFFGGINFIDMSVILRPG
jgi:RHS repeat-associated protein